MAERKRLLESGVRRRKLRGRVRAERDPVLREQRRNVLFQRQLGQQHGLRLVRLRERVVHGRVCPDDDAVLGQRRADVSIERNLGIVFGVHGANADLHERRLHELRRRDAELRREHRERLRGDGQ